MINESNYRKIPKTYGNYCNCWGTTFFLLGITKNYKWQETADSDFVFKQCFSKIQKDQLKTGDVVVLRNYHGELLHSAIYLKETNNFIDKPGSLPIRKTKLKTLIEEYQEDEELEIYYEFLTLDQKSNLFTDIYFDLKLLIVENEDLYIDFDDGTLTLDFEKIS